MIRTFMIPGEVADHARKAATVMQGEAERLEHLHRVFGDGEADEDMGGGDIWEWTVSLDHSEIERLIVNMRRVAEFAEWLARFEAPAAETANE